jgi:hypothetical protein
MSSQVPKRIDEVSKSVRDIWEPEFAKLEAWSKEVDASNALTQKWLRKEIPFSKDLILRAISEAQEAKPSKHLTDQQLSDFAQHRSFFIVACEEAIEKILLSEKAAKEAAEIQRMEVARLAEERARLAAEAKRQAEEREKIRQEHEAAEAEIRRKNAELEAEKKRLENTQKQALVTQNTETDTKDIAIHFATQKEQEANERMEFVLFLEKLLKDNLVQVETLDSGKLIKVDALLKYPIDIAKEISLAIKNCKAPSVRFVY